MRRPPMAYEPEWKTRKKRIDPRLDALGWPRSKGTPGPKPCRTEEEETANGPADYALWIDNQVVGVVEAKKLTVGPQNVLTQADRYSRGLDPALAPGNYDGRRAPLRQHGVGDRQGRCQPVLHRRNRARARSEKHPSGWWRAYDYAEIVARDKRSLDVFWLKDESLEATQSLPPPDETAGEIVTAPRGRRA